MSEGEEHSALEELLAMIAHTHHCTMPYCQAPQRTFVEGDRCADVLHGLVPFGTMHENCARLFRLQWACRQRYLLN